MRIHSGLSRLVSWLLVLCMVMSCLPVYTHSTTPEQGSEVSGQEPGEEADTFFDRVKLYIDGQETRYAELPREGHVTLTAKYEGGEKNVDSFSWQIYDPVECRWISISGSDKAELRVGIALVGEMLNEEDTAVLNCKISADGALYYSDSIQIKVVEAAQEPEVSEEQEEEVQEQEEISAPSAPMARMAQSRAVEGDSAGGELITYTVRVEYINYLTQKEAAKPYIATVKKGTTDLIVYPDSPIVVGFTPYIITKGGLEGAEAITAADPGAEVVYEYTEDGVKKQVYGIETHKLELKLSEVTKDITYQVMYMPNKVYYTVSHYVQNIVNDDYVLYYVETKQGYVGQMTEATNLSEEHPTDPSKAAPLAAGFTALTPFKDQPIAADGTTQINTYYDRMYYLVTFKLDGGRGTEPIYARYGASIHTTVPVKTGYTFAGWLKLEMMQSKAAEIYTPRPAVDDNGNYKPLYTDSERQIVTDADGNFYYVKLVPDTDADGNDEYWGPVDGKGNPVKDTNWPYSQYTLISNDQLPATMPAFHSALQAVWHKADTEYTVIYWLENADRTGTNDVLTEDDFDYWCAVTRYAKSGTRLDAIYKELENPLQGGTGAAAVPAYEQITNIKADELDGNSYAIASARFKRLLTATENGNGLSKGTFVESKKSAEWTFVKQDDNTFKLHSNHLYLVLDNTTGQLLLTDIPANATKFELTVRDYNGTPTISLMVSGGDKYVSEFGGNSGDPFQGYGWDQGGHLCIYSFTGKSEDPEACYYYYYYSDLRDLDTENNVAFEKVNEITVSDDGKTTVNVYFRRRAYNLRFFYARSREESNATSGETKTVYEVIGGSSWQFSQNKNATTIKELLETISDDRWGTVEEPTYLDPNNCYTPGTYKLVIDGYEHTYYYFILKARYGQDIADEWPSEYMLSTKRVGQTQNGNWAGDQAVFSAWNGEYWIKYSREHTNNYTIKGNYQCLDENLLYDPSFNDTYKPEDTDSEGNRYGYYYERGTGTRNLDFVAFYENGNNKGWNVPKQFHYYLWLVSDDQSQAAIDKAIKAADLPNSHTDFASMVEKKAEGETTLAYIDGVVYELYDKVDSCDNATNPGEQTVPGIPGYIDISSERAAGYPSSLAEALAQNKYYYANEDWDRSVYQKAFTLHFRFEAEKKNITLQSWNHIKKLDNIPYGSMVGANRILGLYKDDPEYDYDPGYMYEQMMSDYYPSDLPEGAYYFAGWYKTPEFIEGTMANFDKPMPNYNMILYAKWEPIRFNVHVHQTSELSDLVYYLDEDDGGKHKPMKAEVTQVPLVVHGQTIMVGQEGTGKGYGEYLPTVVPAAGPDKTFEGADADGQRIPTIAENCSELDYVEGSGQIRNKWIFVCYAYMKDGVEHAVDVSSFTITEDVELYAKWTAMDIVSYRVDYVVADVEVKVNEDGTNMIYALRPVVDADGNPVYNENGTPQYIPYPNYVEIPGNEDVTENHWPMTFNDRGRLVYADNDEDMSNNEEWIPKALTVTQDEAKMMYVADSISGKVNEGANRTFEAKTGNELYEIYQFGYFPLHISHSTLMTQDPVTDAGKSEENPIVTTFYYVPLTNVPYRVKYLDKFGNAMVDVDGDGDYDRADMEGALRENSGNDMKMVVTESYVYREGYVPDAFQKTLVLSANEKANVITFLYEKADGQAPYTIQYYYETLGDVVDDTQDGKNYLLHHELSGRVNKNGPLDVDYLDITGFEYAKDIVTMYGLGADNMPQQSGDPITTQNRGDKLSIPTNAAELELTDLRGHKVTVKIVDGEVVFISTDGHTHNLSNSIFNYEYGDVEYRVEAIRIEGGQLVIDGYANPTGSFQLKNEGTRVELGEYGTVIKVYYDLKLYPYYIIHKVDGGEELDITMALQKFQSTVSGSAWTEEQLIEHKDKSYVGYAAKDDDKSITITMTIQDDASTPHINTITFLYYEKMMEFDYVPMLLKNSDTQMAQVVPMPEDEPNAKINLVRDYIKTATGTADAAHPIVHEDAFEFLGWFLDPECTKPVANSAARLYLGTGYEQNGSSGSTLVNQLDAKSDTTADMSQDVYKQYDTLLPQKKVKDYRYWNSDKTGGADYEYIDLANGVYVGGFNEDTKTYDQSETFYALFVPKLGSLTIVRNNVGPNVGFGRDRYNEANSFVYTIEQIKDDNGDVPAEPVVMHIAMEPNSFIMDNSGAYYSAVTITGLPRGTYIIRQENDWSWRYEDQQQEVVISEAVQFKTVQFSTDMKNPYWLSSMAEGFFSIFYSP